MGNKLNHHFVPQHHLRLFSSGRRFVHAAAKFGDRITPTVSIKDQCARNKFYREQSVENWLGTLETAHGVVYRKAVSFAEGEINNLTPKEETTLRGALLLQRSRTPRAAQMFASGFELMVLHTYRQHLSASHAAGSHEAIRAIDDGRAHLADGETLALFIALENAVRTVRAISDLRLVLLRNETDLPLLLGDSPCAFNNYYTRDVHDIGTLGLLSPGLMITMPLTPRTSVLLYDATVYSGLGQETSVFPLTERGDVSRLNVAQLHTVEENFYFAELGSDGYVRDLRRAHAPCFRANSSSFIVRHPQGSDVAGAPGHGELLHTFEPQSPEVLELSFLKTAKLPSGSLQQVRSRELAEEVEQAMGLPSEPAPLSGPNFTNWVEARIRFTPP